MKISLPKKVLKTYYLPALAGLFALNLTATAGGKDAEPGHP